MKAHHYQKLNLLVMSRFTNYDLCIFRYYIEYLTNTLVFIANYAQFDGVWILIFMKVKGKLEVE